MVREFEAIVFDFDGTIVDTETPKLEAWRSLFEDHDCELPTQAWLKCIGMTESAFDPFQYLQDRVGRPLDRRAIDKEQQRRNLALLERLQPLPGVTDWLGEAAELGMKCGIASSSPRNWIEPWLGHLGLVKWISVLTTGDEVNKAKPDPELYQLASQRLGVRPIQAIAVEDSPNGVKASIAAGLFCVAVPNFLTRSLDFQEAHRVLGSLSEMRLCDLRRSD